MQLSPDLEEHGGETRFRVYILESWPVENASDYYQTPISLLSEIYSMNKILLYILTYIHIYIYIYIVGLFFFTKTS